LDRKTPFASNPYGITMQATTHYFRKSTGKKRREIHKFILLFLLHREHIKSILPHVFVAQLPSALLPKLHFV
jgi:hypothetical protein